MRSCGATRFVVAPQDAVVLASSSISRSFKATRAVAVKRKAQDLPHDRGAAASEYAILAALIVAVIVLSVTQLGLKTLDLFNALVF